MTDEITDSEKQMLKLLHEAYAVFILDQTGLQPFAWIRGLSEAPADVTLKYGETSDGKPAVRELVVRMGISDREFKQAVKRSEKGHA